MSAGKVAKRKRLTIGDKVAIIDRLDAGELGITLAKDYGVDKSTMTKIKKNKENIIRQYRVIQEQHGSTERKKMTNIEDGAFERSIYKWFIQQRSMGEPVSHSILAKKAVIYHQQIFGAESKFKASNGWVDRFKKRHGIRSLATQGELHSSLDSASSQEFVDTFTTFLQENGYSLDRVYNAHETGLSWRTLPNRELRSPPECEMRKDLVAVMVCANASGSHKMPLLVVGKSEEPQCFEDVKNPPVIYKGRKSTCMDRDVFLEWYREIFLPNIKGEHGTTAKCLLLLDNAPSHPPIDVLNSTDDACQIMYLPASVTSFIQPMDQGVIVKLKKNYRKQMLHALIEKEPMDPASFLKQLDLTDCCTFINSAWRSLTEMNLHISWNKILANGTVSLDDDALSDDQELMGMLHRVPGYGDCSMGETQAWLEEDAADQGWRSSTDTEIINGMSEENNVGGEESDMGECRANETDEEEDISPEEALAALEKLSRYVESSQDCTYQHVCDLGDIRAVIENDIYSRKIKPSNFEDTDVKKKFNSV